MIKTVRARLLLLILFAIAVFAQAPPAAPTPAAQPQGTPVAVRLNFGGASLTEVIDDLAKELKLNYILDASIVKSGSVTINTYGEVRDLDLRQLLETVLRMNNLAMVQVGNLWRIVPAATVAHQPIDPVTQSDSSKFSEDEHLVLNLVFLHYMTASEMQKILTPFAGESAQITPYEPANLLIILDNSRNMKRTLELINMFDSDSFAGQRVRAYEVKNGRPTDIKKELDDVFKAYALSTTAKGSGAVQFVALDRVNMILAVAPNPGVFTEVDTWLAKLDIVAKVTAGSVDNHLYKLKYQRAEVLGAVVASLYGIPISNPFGNMGQGGLYGGTPGSSSFGGGLGGGFGGGGGGGAFGGNNSFGGSAFGGSQYGGSQQYGSGYNNQYSATQPQTPQANPFNQSAIANGAGGTTPAASDQTGTYLGAAGTGPVVVRPRIVPNPFDNTLLIQSTPEQWEQISKLLEQIDVSPRQVLIEAKIYEVDLTGALSAGVEAFLQNKGATNAGSLTQNLLTGSSNAALSLSAGTMVGQARQLLGALSTNELVQKVKVLSSPTVIATDSIPAFITVGSTVPSLSSQAVNPGVTSGGNSLFTNTVSNVSTGTGLNILARVNPSGVVTMVIDQSVTAPLPASSNSGSTINSPSFSQREVSTQVTVDDGDMIAIGGIINDNKTDTINGIPFLDRIPYLGFLFGQKNTTSSRTELIVFLTPHVIYDTHHISDATQELRDQMKGLRQIIKQNP
jgi:general secretion pathway protein D